MHVPKKTKQEKIIADLRRKLEANQVNTYNWTPQKEKNNEIKPLRQQNEVLLHQSPKVPESFYTSTVLIKKDLLKTLILSLLAVSFELVLYFKLQH